MATVQRFTYERSDSAKRRAEAADSVAEPLLVIHDGHRWIVRLDATEVFRADFFETAEAWVAGFIAGEADTITLERDASGALTGYVRVE